MQSLNIVAIDTAILPQEFNPELRLVSFLQRPSILEQNSASDRARPF
jgi:hypothetical protein